MSNKYVKISPSGELMGEPSPVPPEYWATPKENILTEEERERLNNEMMEEEMLLQDEWQQADEDWLYCSCDEDWLS